MNALPKNVILIIAKFLVPQDIYNLAQTNTFFEFLETEYLLWTICAKFIFSQPAKPPSWNQRQVHKAMCILKLKMERAQCHKKVNIYILTNSKNRYRLLSTLHFFTNDELLSIADMDKQLVEIGGVSKRLGQLIIIREGFAGWDTMLKRYVLIYPMKALRGNMVNRRR